ncbi:MAG: hypothetical protein O7C67_13035 [Gammaproteobacteria bacterium]|nr:hypothetical protein [Gammaproteobacteria bacterium]
MTFDRTATSTYNTEIFMERAAQPMYGRVATMVTVKDKLMALTRSECERRLFHRWLNAAPCAVRGRDRLPFEIAVHRIGNGG